MLSLSYGRRLCTRPAWWGPVTLAAFLAFAMPYPAGGSPSDATRTPKPGAGAGARATAAASLTLTAILTARPDTNSPTDSMAIDHSSSRRSGYVITEDQLDLEQEYPLSSVLIAHIPGIHVVQGSLVSRVATGIHLTLTGAPCYVELFIDGVYVADGDVDLVSVRDLGSVEFRTPGNIPVQYQNRLPGAACGALFLWSKS